jgi:nucleoside-diphosphate-sugar epimerase
LGGIYGPGRELAERAKRLSGKEMAGSGEEPTNHIHLEDIIGGILYSLEHRLIGIYNLVNNLHPTRKKLYSDLCKMQQLPCPIWKGEKVPYKGYTVSNKKIVEAGYNLRVNQL